MRDLLLIFVDHTKEVLTFIDVKSKSTKQSLRRSMKESFGAINDLELQNNLVFCKQATKEKFKWTAKTV